MIDLLTMPEAAAKFRQARRTFADMLARLEAEHPETAKEGSQLVDIPQLRPPR